jgi:two-component system response regulator PilR (NtrC family)
MGRVLVVDDEQGLRDVLDVLITTLGHVVKTAKGVAEAKALIDADRFDLVITDLRLEPGGDGMEVVRASRSQQSLPEVIVMTAYGTRERAQTAISEGASFYLEKGPHLATDIRVLVSQAINKRRLQEENEQLRRALMGRYSASGLVGKSEAMIEVLDMIERVAPLKATILVTGESGTGKERVAKIIHYASDRRSKAFIAVNCGAIPENLIEAELFGHEKGAFTGADEAKKGLFEAAGGGTIFLDEIGELPIALQPKLLRVLQERRIKPIGAVRELEIDVRIIAATNRDLEGEVKAGRFREDLFYRLQVVEIHIPPLRQRREDIPPLVQTFLEKYAREFGREVKTVDPIAMEKLLSYRFPGNVRQLENVIERGVALATADTIGLEQLPKEIATAEFGPTRVALESSSQPFPDEGIDFERMVEDFEYGLIGRALEKANGVKTKAAELLGLSFRQFRYKLAKYEKSRGSTRAS